ncbi:Mn-containing catalase [Bradyrhizobium yuanmingense]|uniref:Mn-containing catalase n=1 Tax=Bradyrhizobium yuanmingense TaxID=108015 RepID=A0ABV4GQX3_9BRAD
MYYFDKRLQYPVRVEKPDPIFARQLQQAIGGVEGEIRVCLQYFFQAWGARGPAKYRDVLLNTATEEISHIEMLSTAVALNLENAPATMQESSMQGNPIVGAVMSGGERPRHVIEGMLHRHILSTGMAAFPANATASRSIVRTSTPAAISPPICIATWPPKPPAERWRCASSTPRAIRACRTCSAT